MKKQNLLVGSVLAGVATLMLVLGIWAFKGDYFCFSSIKYLGDMFSSSFLTGMVCLLSFAMFFLLVANVVVGVLYVVDIVKSERVIKILAEVLAIITLLTFVFYALVTKQLPVWALWFMLIFAIAGAVWNYVYKKIIK